MIASSPLRAAFLRIMPAVSALLAVKAAHGQTVSTYLPPEVVSHGQEPRPGLFQLGMFDLSPHVAASTLYDDNISLHSTNHEDDVIYVLSPGISITKGLTEHDAVTTTRLVYNPAFVFFTKHDTNNSIDHFLNWNGAISLAKLSVSLSQDYESSAGGLADVGSRVSQDFYLTTLRVRYEVSEKTSAEVSGRYRVVDYENLIGSTEWYEDNAINYQFSEKVRLGFGVSIGQLDVGEAPAKWFLGNNTSGKGNSQTFVTPSLRAGYKTSVKTDVSASVGGEWRSYEQRGSAFNPVFSLSGSYAPWEYTTFTIEAHRREQNSVALVGQDYIATGFNFGVSHRLKERYRLHVNLGYDNSEYKAATRGVSATRVDDYYLLRYGADAILANSWTVGVFHQYRLNSSSGGFDFENNQVGLQTVWSY